MTATTDNRELRDRRAVSKRVRFVPCTPGGSFLFYLESKTEEQAIKRLLRDAAHMPYVGWEGFKARGYTIARLEAP